MEIEHTQIAIEATPPPQGGSAALTRRGGRGVAGWVGTLGRPRPVPPTIYSLQHLYIRFQSISGLVGPLGCRLADLLSCRPPVKLPTCRPAILSACRPPILPICRAAALPACQPPDL